MGLGPRANMPNRKSFVAIPGSRQLYHRQGFQNHTCDYLVLKRDATTVWELQADAIEAVFSIACVIEITFQGEFIEVDWDPRR